MVGRTDRAYCDWCEARKSANGLSSARTPLELSGWLGPVCVERLWLPTMEKPLSVFIPITNASSLFAGCIFQRLDLHAHGNDKLLFR